MAPNRPIMNLNSNYLNTIMKRLFVAFVALIAPWLIMLVKDNPGGAFVVLVMQVTLIGWPFASLWAWRTVYPPKDQK
jgi:hypothetical protein